MSGRSRRELGAVLGFIALTFLFFLGKPFHMDEPLFLAPARHIAQDALHPFSFDFNWYGRDVPMAAINNTPPLMLYALAGAWKLTGGSERAMRLLFLPVNLLAAGSLYLLAGLFLSEPLWPALVVVASPAYLINMNLLYPETLALALGFPGLYCLVRSDGGRRRSWFWASGVLCGCAVFSKYGAVFLIPTAVLYAWRRGAPARKILGWTAISLSGVGAYLLYDRMTYRSALGSAWTALSQSVDVPYGRWSHRLRAMLAFTGGGALATAAWPLLAFRPKRPVRLALAGIVALLFMPGLDLAPFVRPVDRLLGVILAFGALAGYWGLFTGARTRGSDLWIPWTASVLVVQALLYWSVIARVILFLLPPLVFAMAESLERCLSGARLRQLYAGTLAGVCLLTAGLAWVDGRYAAAQRDIAADVARQYAGRRLWCAGHWGLQYYLERAGARELDAARGGWAEVRAGDVVVVPRGNSNVLRPLRKLLANVRTVTVREPLPLRLISASQGEGGFYSSATGFLPFSFSAEPIEEFDLVEVLAP